MTRKSSKKYGVYSFPSFHGTPVFTNCYCRAWLIAHCRSIASSREIRIIDNKGNHLLVL